RLPPVRKGGRLRIMEGLWVRQLGMVQEGAVSAVKARLPGRLRQWAARTVIVRRIRDDGTQTEADAGCATGGRCPGGRPGGAARRWARRRGRGGCAGTWCGSQRRRGGP